MRTNVCLCASQHDAVEQVLEGLQAARAADDGIPLLVVIEGLACQELHQPLDDKETASQIDHYSASACS